MDQEQLNAFLESFSQILPQEVGGQVEGGQTYIKTDLSSVAKIRIYFTISGDISGVMVISCDTDTSLNIEHDYRKKNMEDDPDLSSLDILSELFNIIIGRGIMTLSKQDIKCTMSTPNVLENNCSSNIFNRQYTIIFSTPISYSLGELEFDLAIKS